MPRRKISCAFYISFTNMNYASGMVDHPENPVAGTDHDAGFRPRRAMRAKAVGKANLAFGDQAGIEVTVRDLSGSGFMAECAEPVLIGSYISMEVPGIGTVEAQVRWQIGCRMGGMFLDPITLAHCEWVAERGDVAAA